MQIAVYSFLLSFSDIDWQHVMGTRSIPYGMPRELYSVQYQAARAWSKRLRRSTGKHPDCGTLLVVTRVLRAKYGTKQSEVHNFRPHFSNRLDQAQLCKLVKTGHHTGVEVNRMELLNISCDCNICLSCGSGFSMVHAYVDQVPRNVDRLLENCPLLFGPPRKPPGEYTTSPSYGCKSKTVVVSTSDDTPQTISVRCLCSCGHQTSLSQTSEYNSPSKCQIRLHVTDEMRSLHGSTQI